MSRLPRPSRSSAHVSACPRSSNNALLYLAIQKPGAGGLAALTPLAVPIISLDEVDTTVVNTWSPMPSLFPAK